MDDSLLAHIIDGGLGIMSGTAAFVAKLAHAKVREQDYKIAALEKEHDDFRVAVANDYAKNSSMQLVISRLDSTLSEMQRDIKTLLQR